MASQEKILSYFLFPSLLKLLPITSAPCFFKFPAVAYLDGAVGLEQQVHHQPQHCKHTLLVPGAAGIRAPILCGSRKISCQGQDRPFLGQEKEFSRLPGAGEAELRTFCDTNPNVLGYPKADPPKFGMFEVLQKSPPTP